MSDADAREGDQRSSDAGLYGGRSGDRELYESPSFPAFVKNILKKFTEILQDIVRKKNRFRYVVFLEKRRFSREKYRLLF